MACAQSVAASGDASEALIATRIKARITAQNEGAGFVCHGEPICGIQLIPLFYASREFRPAWSDSDGMRPSSRAMLMVLQSADQEGLPPSDYHLEGILDLITQLERYQPHDQSDAADLLADLDLLLSDAVLLLGSHLSAGRVNPETLHSDWIIAGPAIDLLTTLNAVVEAPPHEIEGIIHALRPLHADYQGLRRALQDLRRMAHNGGWPAVPAGGTLRPGDQDARILDLRQRLVISADLPTDGSVDDPYYYDPILEEAVKRFQKRHGLLPDGLVGQNTLAALNVAVQARIRQVELNLERWRWLPKDLGERYLLVNTADFSLKAIEAERAVLDMRVVVGRPARQSPVFSARMTYLVLNPYWTVPTSIAVKDILPRLKKGENYLSEQGFKVFNGWSDTSEEIDPELIDWSIYTRSHFPFRLRQEPGPHNALGSIKFMFPNKFAVYLHDTPQRTLFNRVKRDFSSGCIRVEDALGLAAYVLADDPAWALAGIEAALATSRDRVVRLPNPMPIHLLYMTAWMSSQEGLQFRYDIYGRDAILDKALKYRPPRSTSAVRAKR